MYSVAKFFYIGKGKGREAGFGPSRTKSLLMRMFNLRVAGLMPGDELRMRSGV